MRFFLTSFTSNLNYPPKRRKTRRSESRLITRSADVIEKRDRNLRESGVRGTTTPISFVENVQKIMFVRRRKLSIKLIRCANESIRKTKFHAPITFPRSFFPPSEEIQSFLVQTKGRELKTSKTNQFPR